MSDLELIKKCAERMGLTIAENRHGFPIEWVDEGGYQRDYNPLHNDIQAMALVKKFKLGILRSETDNPKWEVVYGLKWGRDEDLNRAIVECVARMDTESISKSNTK